MAASFTPERTYILFALPLYINFINVFIYCICQWKLQDSELSLLGCLKLKN